MSKSIYRIDKFSVPRNSREEFLSAVRSTHVFLRTLPGFSRDMIVENTSEDGRYSYVTLAEWESEEAINMARIAVQGFHKLNGFDPQTFWKRLGVKAELASYQPVDT